MVSSRTASRGQITNSPSSCLYPLLKRQLLRRFGLIHLLSSFTIITTSRTTKRTPTGPQTHIGHPIITVIIFPE